MFKNTIFRRMTALVLTLALAAAAALPGLAVYPMPIQTASETEAVYLFNADTGKTILNQNAGQQQSNQGAQSNGGNGASQPEDVEFEEVK